MPENEYPKMLSKEIEIDNPLGGKIKRLVPLRYAAGAPKAGQLVVFHDEHEEKVYNQEVPAVEPVMSHMEQDTSHPKPATRERN